MIIKTSELEGSALDWAVAKVEGYDTVIHEPNHYRNDKKGGIHCCEHGCTFGPRSLTGDSEEYSPSTDWRQGGPLIERFEIDIESGPWSAYYRGETMHGDTPLVAACRAIIAAELGDSVDVPEELLS